MILLIDNYDSFSYNLYQLIGTIEPRIKVVRNDEITVEQIAEFMPSHIIISPGPGKPENAGISIDTVKFWGGKIPILGVCLGHQAICEAYGARVSYAKSIMHGKTSMINIETSSKIFKGLNKQIIVGRYHSLAVIRETIPSSIKIIAETADGEIMAIEHQNHQVFGLQFHPESILTPLGMGIINNFFGGISND